MNDFVVCVYEWQCYDDECDCVQPIVEIRSTHSFKDHRWTSPKRISEGPFVSYGYGADKKDSESQKKWLEEAREWYFQ